MSEPSINGDKRGVVLLTQLINSTDEMEKAYYNRIISAAIKFHRAWFTDVKGQYIEKCNQITYQLSWNAEDNAWMVYEFLVPMNKRTDLPKVKARVINKTTVKAQTNEGTAKSSAVKVKFQDGRLIKGD